MANAEAGYNNYFALPVAPADTTITLGTAPTTTSGRVYAKNADQEEWIDYTGVSGATITGCTRNMSQTADPSTGGTGLTWIAGTPVVLVWMHDQLPMKTKSNTYTAGTVQTFPDIAFSGTTTPGFRSKGLTTAEINALDMTGISFAIAGDSTLQIHKQYIGGVWTTFATGGATPAASTTALGGIELATQAENTAGTTSGSVGSLMATPNIMATTIQRGERLYAGASAAGTDTYAVTMTPAPAAYTTGMRLSFLTDVANTGAATINVNALGAKSIKTIQGSDPVTGEIPTATIINLQYDGTNMVLQNPPQVATTAEAITGTNIFKYTTPAEVLTVAKNNMISISRDRDATTATVTYTHGLGRTPRAIYIRGMVAADTSYTSDGFYCDGTSFCFYGYGANSGGTQTFAVDLGFTAGQGQKGVIQNITSTQFDIVRTKAGTTAGSCNYIAIIS